MTERRAWAPPRIEGSSASWSKVEEGKNGSRTSRRKRNGECGKRMLPCQPISRRRMAGPARLLANVFDVTRDAIINRRSIEPLKRLIVMETTIAVSIKRVTNNRPEQVRIAIHRKSCAGGVENRPH